MNPKDATGAYRGKGDDEQTLLRTMLGTLESRDVLLLGNEWLAGRRIGIAVYPVDDIEQFLNQWQKTSSGKILAVESETAR